MRRIKRGIAAAIVLIGAGGICATAALLLAAGSNQPEAVPAPPAAIGNVARAVPRYVGAGSCAARACHGNPMLNPNEAWNSAYAIWAQHDPHKQAYAVLTTQVSKDMAERLRLGDPAKADRCLACHSLPVGGAHSADAVGDAAAILADGVSCEACHGPAENYLAAHSIRAWLPKVMDDPHFGMKKTADIETRSQICVNCHVGQPGPDGRPWRDVNHDLIAAGHPRLSFELSAFMATMPPHWNTRKNLERFDAVKSWLTGQFTSADAALKLLESRAKAAASGATKAATAGKPAIAAPWPEFAEYDCFACHHALNSPSWRQGLDASQHQPGTPTWGSWYFEGPRLVAGTAAPLLDEQRSELAKHLQSLTGSMQSLLGKKQPGGDAGQIAREAGQSQASLAEYWHALHERLAQKAGPADSAELRGDLVKSLWNQFQEHEPTSWDGYTQYYLALVALDQTKAATKTLDDIRSRLSFPPSPAEMSESSPSSPLRVLRPGVNSPQNFDPRAFGLRVLFERAFQQLSNMSPPL